LVLSGLIFSFAYFIRSVFAPEASASGLLLATHLREPQPEWNYWLKPLWLLPYIAIGSMLKAQRQYYKFSSYDTIGFIFLVFVRIYIFIQDAFLSD
jgi:hypothetical protein